MLPAALRERPRLTEVLLVLLVSAALWASVAKLPYFSESHVLLQLADIENPDGWTDIFDTQRYPWRPLQHLVFFELRQLGTPSPAVARVLGFGMHAISCLLVMALARRLGAGRTGGRWAGAIFLASPCIKNLAWVAAIGTPGRVTCLLAALVLLLDTGERPSPLRSLGGLIAFVLALGFHQSAVVLPGFLVLHLLCTSTGGWKDRLLRLLARLRRPDWAGVVLLGIGYALWMTFLRPERHNEVSGLRSLAVKATKASMWYIPEDLRHFAVEGFRGSLGTAGLIGGGLVLAATAAWAAWLLLRGRPVTRFIVLAVLLDMVLPVLLAGFHQRYAYLGNAFVAAGFGAWVGRSIVDGRIPQRVLLGALLVVAWWGADNLRDIAEYREAGAVHDRLLDQAAAERARVGEGKLITVIDAPDAWGREEDLPLFNLAFDFAATDRGIPGPWAFWRTRPFITATTNFKLVDPSRIEVLRMKRSAGVLLYDPDLERFLELEER